MLEVYEPGSMDNVWVYFKSDGPFLSINSGDLLNPNLWENSQSPMKILKVINLEHIIWEKDNIVKHKLMVFTEEIDGTIEARLSRNN